MASKLSKPLEHLAENFILSQMIDRLLETTWSKYLPDSARDVFIDDMRKFSRMVAIAAENGEFGSGTPKQVLHGVHHRNVKPEGWANG